MMKKLFSTALALCLALSLCVPAALAVEPNTLDNFQQTAVYENQFIDVAANHWALSSVKTCYEYGLMKGSSATTFNPTGELTVAEALVMACRVHEIYAAGASTITNGSPWYQPAVDYALANQLIKEGDFADYTAKVTRAEMTYIFCNALPSFPGYNYIEYIPDVDDTTPYADEIMTLYRGGVLTGSDAYGTFNPYRTITRAEAAAIIARVAIPAERKSGHVLMEDWTLGEDVVFAMPQGGQQIDTGMENSAAVATANAKYAVTFTWQYDEAYADLAIDMLTLDYWHSNILSSYESGGMALYDAQTELVYYASVPAYRTTAGYNDNEGGGMTVCICYIANNELVIAVYTALEYKTDTLYSIANHLNVGGSMVDKKL